MNAINVFLQDLAESLPTSAGTIEDGIAVAIDELELDMPIEIRIETNGLCVSLPRGRLATGFDPQHGRVRVRFSRGDG
jgi:hypothetical protein